MNRFFTRMNVRGVFAVVFLLSAVPVALTQQPPGAPPPPPKVGRIESSPPKPGSPTAYYVCIFAYDAIPHAPRTSHTFATFVKTDGRAFEAHTISWLPASNVVRLIRRRAEPGVNHDLKTTLEIAKAENARVQEWGPFQIKPELYARALRQIDTLKSGRVAYKALDGGGRAEGVSNCIHAVSDVDTDRGLLETGTKYGVEASAMVVEHLRPWFINPEVQYTWINVRLGMVPNAPVAQNGPRGLK